MAIPGTALAHIERPSYWPNPKPDRSVHPAAGGKVPKARSLASALNQKAPGDTRVVCKPNSMSRLKNSIHSARRHGYDIRPHDHRSLSKGKAHRLLKVNRGLANHCRYHQIQPAVFDSGNNDRVVIMPGLYKEPHSRKQPTFDPKCDKYEITSDRGEPGALSYAYQVHCPNDQNLIAVNGRKIGKKPPPDPPKWDRHGIPDLGPCIRCNMQMEGSGVSADDVIVEAGDKSAGNGGPNGVGSAKDVGIGIDRADGFVLRNVTVRHAGEHGIYILETDGYLFTRFKAYYDRLYGVLTFVEDHGLMKNCDVVGHGDSGLYPGGAAETGEQRRPGTKYRYNQEIRHCDLHHNLAGYSGTDGNAIHVDQNNFYDNALGFQTDVVTAAGHPGFPDDSDLIEHNNFYSNNFNPYEEGTDIEASFPFPVGTGMWIAGGNNHTISDNHFFNNWRRGTMLYAVPDSLVCGPDSGNEQKGCDPSQTTTSHRNKYFHNVMGVTPSGKSKPNGTDFWWDDFPGNTGNCWWGNKDPNGVTTSPPLLPDCDNGANPNSSVGTGYPPNEAELLQCFAAYESGSTDPADCPWFGTPPKPSSSQAQPAQSPEALSDARRSFFQLCRSGQGSEALCDPFGARAR
jgi:hypothetical protein